MQKNGRRRASWESEVIRCTLVEIPPRKSTESPSPLRGQQTHRGMNMNELFETSVTYDLATLHVMNIINGSHNLNLIIDESVESLTYHHPILMLNRIDGEHKYHINVIGNTFEIGLLLVTYGATKQTHTEE